MTFMIYTPTQGHKVISVEEILEHKSQDHVSINQKRILRIMFEKNMVTEEELVYVLGMDDLITVREPYDFER